MPPEAPPKRVRHDRAGGAIWTTGGAKERDHPNPHARVALTREQNAPTVSDHRGDCRKQ